jgi:hypothetical protein
MEIIQRTSFYRPTSVSASFIAAKEQLASSRVLGG